MSETKTTKIELAKDVKSWTDARKIIFDKIYQIIEDNQNCGTYEIMGYPFLSVKLILRFHDCFQVFEFDYFGNDCVKNQNTIQLEKFFTEDFISDEQMNNTKDFADRYNRDKPEIKK